MARGRQGACGCGCALTPKTSKGFSAVEFAENVIGVTLLPWQRWLLIHALELLPTGAFRFRTVLVLVARQNGKTTVVELKNLWKMYVLQVPLVIGTAQNLDISEESWDKAVEIAESIPDLAAEIAHVDKTNGKKALRLTSGSRWKIAAASRKGGRGLSGDDVNLDELREHQTWDSWGAVTKTTMARPNAQTWAYSNAGDDKSVVLNDLQGRARTVAQQLFDLLAQMVVAEAEQITREAAKRGIDTRLGLFEWSAPDYVKCTCGRPDGVHRDDCRLQDRNAWAQANPSLGYTITEEAIASALGTDPVGVFRTEVLCQRVENLADEWQIIGETPWNDARDPTSRCKAPAALAVEVSLDRSQACIAVAGRRLDDPTLRHVELADLQAGTSWVVARVVEMAQRWRPCAVVVDSGGPAGSLIPDLEAAGIEVLKPTVRQFAGACGAMRDGIAGLAEVQDRSVVRDIRHIGQAPLTAAIKDLSARKVSETEVWERAGLGYLAVAGALALWGHAMRAPLTYDPLDSVFVGGA